MKMTEILEKDREKLLFELSREKTPAASAAVVLKELDRLLTGYNSEEEVPEKRQAAAQMIEAVKAFVPAIDGIGDTKLWERTVQEKKQHKSPALLIVLLVLCMVFLAGTVFFLTVFDFEETMPQIFREKQSLLSILPVLAVLFSFLTGLWLGIESRTERPDTEKKLEIFTDGEKLLRILQAAVLTVDRELEQMRSCSMDTGTAGGERKFTDQELRFYLSVFEAGYAEADGSLSECVENLRYFLHQKGIETEEYSEAHDSWFERMPGKEKATIRPALVKGGELFRKGLAVTGV